MKKLLLCVLLALAASACGNNNPSAPAATPPTTAPAPTATPALPKVVDDLPYQKKAKEAISAYGVSPELDKLPDFSADDQDGWQELVGMSLAYFVSEPQTYNEKKGLEGSEYGDIPEVRRRARNHTREVMVAYGIFQLGNNPVRHDYLKRAVSLLWKSEFRDVAYRLTVPSIKKALAAMPAQDRADYLRILRHTSRYMTTFNVVREARYIASLQGSDCYGETWEKKYYKLPQAFDGRYRHCKELFTHYGPDGKEDPYRKAEAFVYRRVVYDGWKVIEMKQVLDRLINDLQ